MNDRYPVIQYGLCLTELLISQLLAVIVIAALIQTVMLCNHFCREIQQLAMLNQRAQQVARVLRQYIQQAGYAGCLSLPASQAIRIYPTCSSQLPAPVQRRCVQGSAVLELLIPRLPSSSLRRPYLGGTSVSLHKTLAESAQYIIADCQHWAFINAKSHQHQLQLSSPLPTHFSTYSTVTAVQTVWIYVGKLTHATPHNQHGLYLYNGHRHSEMLVDGIEQLEITSRKTLFDFHVQFAGKGHASVKKWRFKVVKTHG